MPRSALAAAHCTPAKAGLETSCQTRPAKRRLDSRGPRHLLSFCDPRGQLGTSDRRAATKPAPNSAPRCRRKVSMTQPDRVRPWPPVKGRPRLFVCIVASPRFSSRGLLRALPSAAARTRSRARRSRRIVDAGRLVPRTRPRQRCEPTYRRHPSGPTRQRVRPASVG